MSFRAYVESNSKKVIAINICLVDVIGAHPDDSDRSVITMINGRTIIVDCEFARVLGSLPTKDSEV